MSAGRHVPRRGAVRTPVVCRTACNIAGCARALRGAEVSHRTIRMSPRDDNSGVVPRISGTWLACVGKDAACRLPARWGRLFASGMGLCRGPAHGPRRCAWSFRVLIELTTGRSRVPRIFPTDPGESRL